MIHRGEWEGHSEERDKQIMEIFSDKTHLKETTSLARKKTSHWGQVIEMERNVTAQQIVGLCCPLW